MNKKLTYRTSGVDIDAANVFIQKIKPLVKSAQRKEALSPIGGFGGLFALAQNKYKNPVLVSSTDGVGTKLKIAQELGRHTTVGIDLVAMNVNDILCLGAEPLFFLDYIACGRLDPKVLVDVVKGVTEGCKQAGCALIGGETAEMPGMYKRDEYDLAGFSVGVVEKSKIIDGKKIKKGDTVIGIQSNGLHSNGFSLVRKALSKSEIKKHAKEILKPTKIYVKPVLSLIKKFDIKGIAHVTGGAYYEKIPRILPKGLSIQIKKRTWPIPNIFTLIQKKGNISEYEMFRTFNMGIGMVLIVNAKDTLRIKSALRKYKLKSWIIGEVAGGRGKTVLV
ncbi:phosphoribosylformylglycinamidine cyclo-ligase [Candidatus Omnitrophota bacterium]